MRHLRPLAWPREGEFGQEAQAAPGGLSAVGTRAAMGLWQTDLMGRVHLAPRLYVPGVTPLTARGLANPLFPGVGPSDV